MAVLIAVDGGWHTGKITGIYMLAVFVCVPLWGYATDRSGRRSVILLGLALGARLA